MKTNFDNFETSFCTKTQKETLLEIAFIFKSLEQGKIKFNNYFLNLKKGN